MLIKSVNKKAKFVAVNRLTHKMNLPLTPGVSYAAELPAAT